MSPVNRLGSVAAVCWALAVAGCSVVKGVKTMEVNGGVANPNSSFARWATWEPAAPYFDWDSYRGQALPKHPGRDNGAYNRFLKDYRHCGRKAADLHAAGDGISKVLSSGRCNTIRITYRGGCT